MSADDRIPLREAADRLAGYNRYRRTQSRGKRELLKLLQGEKIQAAFEFPSEARPQVNVPATFWKDTRSGDFLAQLTNSARHGRQGQFLISPVKFVDGYVSWFAKNYLGDGVNEAARRSAAAELTSALAGIRKKIEVFILESEWACFVQSAGLDEIEHQDRVVKSTRGRRPREEWETVLVEVASQMLAHDSRGRAIENEQTAIANSALSRAENDLGRSVHLKAETVAKKIRLILNKRDALL